MNDLAASRRTQADLYGAPLSDCVGRLTQAFALSQAALARTLGISAPMLSQLVSGQRIKIGNPVAVQRLQSLIELAEEVDEGLEHREMIKRLDQIAADDSTSMTRARGRTPVPGSPEELPQAFAQLLHAVASGRELREAASLLAADHPGLAELLRVYGAGSAQARSAHYASVRDLL